MLLDALDRAGPLLVSVTDGDLAALGRIDLDFRGEPFLEPVLVGEGLPDLLGSSLNEGLALDPGSLLVSRSLSRLFISQLHGCLWYRRSCNRSVALRDIQVQAERGGPDAAGPHGRRAECPR